VELASSEPVQAQEPQAAPLPSLSETEVAVINELPTVKLPTPEESTAAVPLGEIFIHDGAFESAESRQTEVPPSPAPEQEPDPFDATAAETSPREAEPMREPALVRVQPRFPIDPGMAWRPLASRRDDPMFHALPSAKESSLETPESAPRASAPALEERPADPPAISTDPREFASRAEEGLRSLVPRFQQLARSMNSLPDDPGPLRELLQDVEKIRSGLSEAQDGYDFALSLLPEEEPFRERIAKIDALLKRLSVYEETVRASLESATQR